MLGCCFFFFWGGVAVFLRKPISCFMWGSGPGECEVMNSHEVQISLTLFKTQKVLDSPPHLKKKAVVFISNIMGYTVLVL